MSQFPSVWAKSSPKDDGEALTEHSALTHEVARQVEQRVGRLARVPEWFWRAVALAALLHDFGKIDPGFQGQVRHPGQRRYLWGQRHEVLSLGAVKLLLPNPSEYRRWVAVAVATHHKPLRHPDSRQEILEPHLADEAEPVSERFAVAANNDTLWGLLRWFHDRAWSDRLLDQPRLDIDLARRADVLDGVHTLLLELRERWGTNTGQPGTGGVELVLLQGAVTLADHVASAHGELLGDQPLENYPSRLAETNQQRGRTLHPHQQEAQAAPQPHLLLRAPTGSGKTEGGLLWAHNAIAEIKVECGGHPRVFYVLPYLASINAMTDRLRTQVEADIGVLHSKAGVYHFGEDTDDAPARALAALEATRLHRELLRVTTPYQLLRAAFAGAVASSTLLDTAAPKPATTATNSPASASTPRRRDPLPGHPQNRAPALHPRRPHVLLWDEKLSVVT